MPSLLNRISRLGIDEFTGRDAVRGISLANQISLLCVFIGTALFLLQGTLIGWSPLAFSSGIVSVFFIFPLLANYAGKSLLGRTLLTFYLPTGVFLASVLTKVINTDSTSDFETQYYDYRFFLMISGIVPIVLYERNRKIWSYLALTYVLVLLLLFDPVHNLLEVGYYQTGHRDPTYYFTNVIVILAFCAQMIGQYILRFSIDKNEDELLNEIEERKKAEHEILLAKEKAVTANKAKSEFLANVSHEIRTPLNGVVGFSDLLLKTPLNDMQKRYMGALNKSALLLVDRVNEILDYSKIEAGKMELELEKTNVFEIARQTGELMKPQADQKNLKFLLTLLPSTPAIIRIDSVRLNQVLINLIDNAIKFTENGEVELKVEPVRYNGDERSGIRFSVRDTGIGIDPQNQQRIFEAFTQVDSSNTKKFGGTGLGLTITHKLLALMGSQLGVQSELGKGSTFYFEMRVK